MIERELYFDVESHSADAIQRAVYRFSDRLSAEVKTVEHGISCRLFIDPERVSDVELAVGDFRNEVIDQVLRERIRLETEAVRNAVLALAFSNTGLTPAD